MTIMIISIGTQTDVTGTEHEYFKMGAKNLAGYVRIHQSVPAMEVERVKAELLAWSNEAALPATLANVRF